MTHQPFDSPDPQMAGPSSQPPVALIEQLLAIGNALSSTCDLEEILHLILTKSREITWSDAGSVFLLEKRAEQAVLVLKVAQNDSMPNDPLPQFILPLTSDSLAGYVAITGETLNLADAYHLPKTVPYCLNRSFDQETCYYTRSVLVLPMQNQQGETIGVLQLINRKTQVTAIVTAENAVTVTQAYSDWEQRILRSLASQAAISIERNHLQQSIENLFEGFVRAAVQIIEARDPCTSGHSERVADLSVRLIQEVNGVSVGPLGSFQFSDRQIQELRYAALLHDFGKVGVPEAVLTKCKKLYPGQLEVIRERFAVARRTLELDTMQAKFQLVWQSNNSPVASSWGGKHLEPDQDLHRSQDCCICDRLHVLDQQLVESLAHLDRYWLLILQANEPQTLVVENWEELQILAELEQYNYRNTDGQLRPLLTPAELNQLRIQLGNLTGHERRQMQSHVIHTYRFLKQIPWTAPLQGIPQIAAGHHEKLDGTGYPHRLQKHEIPIQAQMMAIADIYDALTAGDRPYKKPLSPTVALGILRQEAGLNHINADLVALFEQRQVFRVLGH